MIMQDSHSRPALFEVDMLLCRLLKGVNVAWQDIGHVQRDTLLERINFHGIQAMVWSDIQHGDWPDDVKAQLHEASISFAGWELGHMHALGQVLSRFALASVDYLLFKGTALAYTLYPNPVHRMRGDTDILVPLQDKASAEAVLDSSGFTPGSTCEELVYYQQTWRLDNACGGQHAIDLHWRFNNSELLADLFGFGELAARADSVSICGVQVKVPCKSDAVLIACLHKAVHDYIPYWVDGKSHTEGSRLIWLYDLHLLISHFRVQDWHDLAERALANGLGQTCAAVLACWAVIKGLPVQSVLIWLTGHSRRLPDPDQVTRRSEQWVKLQ
jgi:hypothetical protein